MAANSNPRNPPILDSSTTFENWEMLVELWQAVTDLKAEKQGPALVLALSHKAREAALEIPMTDIKSSNGVELIKQKLGKIYKKDSVDSAYEAFESFIHFKRDSETTMSDFISEFERKHAKAKAHGFDLSTSVLAFFLLNQAQLEEEKKQLIKATITKLEYEEMKTKLTKVFGSTSIKDTGHEMQVKVEELCLAEDEEEAFYYGNWTPNRGNPRFSRFTRPSRGRQQGFGFRGRMRAGQKYSGMKKRCNIC